MPSQQPVSAPDTAGFISISVLQLWPSAGAGTSSPFLTTTSCRSMLSESQVMAGGLPPSSDDSGSHDDWYTLDLGCWITLLQHLRESPLSSSLRSPLDLLQNSDWLGWRIHNDFLYSCHCVRWEGWMNAISPHTQVNWRYSHNGIHTWIGSLIFIEFVKCCVVFLITIIIISSWNMLHLPWTWSPEVVLTDQYDSTLENSICMTLVNSCGLHRKVC